MNKKLLTLIGIIGFCMVLVAFFIFKSSLDSRLFENKEKCFDRKQSLESQYSIAVPGVSISIENVFYSPKVKSCLFIKTERTVTQNQPGANGTVVTYSLIDLLGDDLILAESGCSGELSCGQTTIDAYDVFNEKVKAYK